VETSFPLRNATDLSHEYSMGVWVRGWVGVCVGRIYSWLRYTSLCEIESHLSVSLSLLPSVGEEQILKNVYTSLLSFFKNTRLTLSIHFLCLFTISAVKQNTYGRFLPTKYPVCYLYPLSYVLALASDGYSRAKSRGCLSCCPLSVSRAGVGVCLS
jgi:hypothetical protein